MKKLSDYQGEEAIELWADLLEPLSAIIADKRIAGVLKKGNPTVLIAKQILKDHKKEAAEILLRIDPEPITGLNILTRLIGILNEMMESEEVRDFFTSPGQTTAKESSGSATENIADAEM